MINFVKKQGLLYAACILVIGLSVLWVFPHRGLVGNYYDNLKWEGMPIFSQRVREIDLEALRETQTAFPQRQRNFSVAWEGWLHIRHTGEYTFATIADGDSYLVIDGVMVVDNKGGRKAKRAAGTLFLHQGMYPIKISYSQKRGDYTLQVFWIDPGKQEAKLPSQHLYARPFPLKGLGFLIQNLMFLYLVAWGFLIIVAGQKIVTRNRANIAPFFKEYVKNVALSVITIVLMLLIAEGVIRLTMHVREQRKDLQIMLKESQEAELPDNPQTYSMEFH